MSESLIHERAWQMAVEAVAVFSPVLREEEIRQAFDIVLGLMKQGLKEYEMKADRMHKRLHPIPSEN